MASFGMDEKLLLKLSISSTVIGLVALFVIAMTTTLDESSMVAATSADANKLVRITGRLERITARENVTILQISHQEKVTAVAFENLTAVSSLAVGDAVDVTGRLSFKREKPEIIVDEVREFSRG